LPTTRAAGARGPLVMQDVRCKASFSTKNQTFYNEKRPIAAARRASNQEVGNSNLSEHANVTSAYQSFSSNGMRSQGCARSYKPIDRPTHHR
jgi:hypothetical protein